MLMPLGLLLVSLTLTTWVAFGRGGAAGPVGMARNLTEGALYLVNLPLVVWVLGLDVVMRVGAVVLVFGGVYLAHRAIFAAARRYRDTRDGSGGAGRGRAGVAK